MPLPLLLLPAVAVGAGVLWWTRRGADRGAHVQRAFLQSVNQPYSYGGGHPIARAQWPIGSPGLQGGVGWDCSGWVWAVVRRAGNSRLPVFDTGASGMYKAAGSPRNGTRGARKGDLIWWGSGLGDKPASHVGFYMGKDESGVEWAVSAFGAGSSVNGDNPSSRVMRHRVNGVGSPVLGTFSW